MSKRAARQLGLKFPVLSDSKADVIRRYGLVHAGGGPEGQDIAIPTLLLIDKGGRVAWRHVSERVQDRVAPSDILAEIERLEKSPG